MDPSMIPSVVRETLAKQCFWRLFNSSFVTEGQQPQNCTWIYKYFLIRIQAVKTAVLKHLIGMSLHVSSDM